MIFNIIQVIILRCSRLSDKALYTFKSVGQIDNGLMIFNIMNCNNKLMGSLDVEETEQVNEVFRDNGGSMFLIIFMYTHAELLHL